MHLRSDLERKSLFAAAETDRLGPEHYEADVTAQVYDRLLGKARIALDAGRAVVVDAVFSKRHERDAAEALARDLGVPFHGLWLQSAPEVLIARVDARTGDASDATRDVVAAQLDYDTGVISWLEVDAGGSPDDTLRSATAALALP